MPNYRRFHVRGASYFFCVNLAEPGAQLLTDRIDALRAAYGATYRDLPFATEAVTVLPSQIQAIWTLPPGDTAYSERWRRIKYRFTRAVSPAAPVRPSLAAKRERGLWQRRFWEHMLRDATDFEIHLRQVYAAPLHRGLVTDPHDWPFSSLHRDLRRGRPLPTLGVAA